MSNPSPVPDDWPEHTVLVAVTARVKPGYTADEVGDVIAFHLDLTDLTTSDVDYSAVRFTKIRLNPRLARPAPPPEPCDSNDVHDPHGRCPGLSQ